MYTALRSNLRHIRIQSLLKTIARDATHYFLVIFTSQLLLELTLVLARVRVLSYLRVLPFWLAEAPVAFDQTGPRRVSNTMVRLLRFFFHQVLLCGTVDTSCTSKCHFASEPVGPKLRVRYLPVMVGRLMLSLRKAAALQGGVWSFGEPATSIGMRFAERRGPDATGDGMHLGTSSGGREEVQTRA